MQSTSRQALHADQATYRDLVIFEERLRGNMTRLQRRKRKYEGIIIIITIDMDANFTIS